MQSLTSWAFTILKTKGRVLLMKKRLIIGLMLLSAILLIAACGTSNEDNGSGANVDAGTDATQNEAQEEELQTLRVSYNMWVGSSGLFVAHLKDMFTEAGLDVELIQFSNPTESVQALMSGNVDIAMATLDTAVMLKDNDDESNPFKVIAVQDLSNGADGIVAHESITSLEELEGTKIAATIGAINHYVLAYALSTVGLSESDITLVNMAPDTTGSAFLSGNVDAAVTWEPFLSEAADGGGNIIFSTADAPDLIIDVMMANQDVIENYEREIKLFVEILDEGVEYFHSNFDEGVELVAEFMGTPEHLVEQMVDGVILVPAEESARMMTTDLNEMELAVDFISEFLLSHDLISNAVSPDDMFDSFLYE